MEDISVFPPLSFEDVLQCQFSSWYPAFEKNTIRARTIRPLSAEFRKYLESDGVVLPEGSEDEPEIVHLSDDDSGSSSSSDSSDELDKFAFPELDLKIRNAISEYGAVFPKLNWTSPRDASWMLAPSSPLKCTSPADVYLFLKSSDFISHDLDPTLAFEGCNSLVEGEVAKPPSYDLELVLKKWYAIETSREMRCFVRDNKLIGISQRDSTFYEFLNEQATNASLRTAIIEYWKSSIFPIWRGSKNYVVDILLTRDLARAHVVDFNPFAPRTDPLLFTYPELRDIYASSLNDVSLVEIPEFRVISSSMHPAATRSAPKHAHNMMPREALELSAGRNILDFQEAWAEELDRALQSDTDSGHEVDR